MYVYGVAWVTFIDYRDEPRECDICQEQLLIPEDLYIDVDGNEMLPRACKDCRRELGLSPAECTL